MKERPYIALLVIIVVLTAITLINFVVLVVKESNRIVFPRIQILNMRIASFLLLFSIIFIFKFVFVEDYRGIDVCESVVEAYSVYCFYKMQIFYVGSKENVHKALLHSKQKFVIGSGLENKYPEWYLFICELFLRQFLFIRPFFTLALALVNRENRRMFVLFTVLQIASMIFGMIGLLRMSFVLSHHTRRLGAMNKLLFLKGVILAIILENLVANIIALRGPDHLIENNIERVYNTIAVIQLCIASFFLQRIFLSDTDMLMRTDFVPAGSEKQERRDSLNLTNWLTAKNVSDKQAASSPKNTTISPAELVEEGANSNLPAQVLTYVLIPTSSLYFLLRVLSYVTFVFQAVDSEADGHTPKYTSSDKASSKQSAMPPQEREGGYEMVPTQADANSPVADSPVVVATSAEEV